MLAAGLEAFDPEEAYNVALMDDARKNGIDREIALSYVRNAHAFENISPEDLERAFPAVLDAVSHLDNPPETGLAMISRLLNRHGASVSSVMRNTLRNSKSESFPDASLPKLYGDTQRVATLPGLGGSIAKEPQPSPKTLLLEIDEQKRQIRIDERISIQGKATVALSIELSKLWLDGAGRGFNPLDYPCSSASHLAKQLGLTGEEAVRRRVLRARSQMKQYFASCGMEEGLGQDMIENVSWHGYRLRPGLVVVRMSKAS